VAREYFARKAFTPAIQPLKPVAGQHRKQELMKDKLQSSRYPARRWSSCPRSNGREGWQVSWD